MPLPTILLEAVGSRSRLIFLLISGRIPELKRTTLEGGACF